MSVGRSIGYHPISKLTKFEIDVRCATAGAQIYRKKKMVGLGWSGANPEEFASLRSPWEKRGI